MSEQFTAEQLSYLQEQSLDRKIMITQTRILEWHSKWNGNVFISFSGGKDSTVLLDLARRMYPDIPAVFFNTGLEYPEIRKFALAHEGVEEIRPLWGRAGRTRGKDPKSVVTFKDTLTYYGYPLISKQVSNVINEARRNIAGSRYRRLHGEYQRREGGKKSQFDQSRYLPLSELPILISEKCCEVNKKGPSHIYQHRTGRKNIVATMAEESLLRRQAWLTTGCNAFNAREPISKPMSIWREQDVLEYITRYDTEICSVYGQIEKTDGKLRCTGCQRTGCVYCPLGVHLEKGETRFQRLKKTHPSLYEYCMGGGEWQTNIKYDCTITDTRVWNPKEVWGPSNGGLGMAKIFDMINAIYGKDFIRYE